MASFHVGLIAMQLVIGLRYASAVSAKSRPWRR
jgi:hypothetical protein